MARRQNDDSFLNDELEAAFNFGDDLMETSKDEAFTESEQIEMAEEENFQVSSLLMFTKQKINFLLKRELQA